MSVKVDLRELAAKIDEYDYAYLVTVGGDGRAHVLSVWPDPTPEGLVVDGVGRHSQENASDRPEVTLVWPPAAPDGYSLLVDGQASVDGSTITVLHVSCTRGICSAETIADTSKSSRLRVSLPSANSPRMADSCSGFG